MTYFIKYDDVTGDDMYLSKNALNHWMGYLSYKLYVSIFAERSRKEEAKREMGVILMT